MRRVAENESQSARGLRTSGEGECTGADLDGLDIEAAFARLARRARQKCAEQTTASDAALAGLNALELHVLEDTPGRSGEDFALRALLRDQLGGPLESAFEHLRWHSNVDGVVSLSVETELVRQHLEFLYQGALDSACRALFANAREVKLIARTGGQQDVGDAAAAGSEDSMESTDMAVDVLRPTKPLLSDLAGMPEAGEWGKGLARDLESYGQKRIAWKDVDPGALLCGPPGTGKTTFAQALAATCKIPLVATSYTNWQQSKSGHLGNVLAAMEKDFATARKQAPCILFIDELDTIPSRRRLKHNDDWWVSIVNALLEKLDGIAGRPGVVVLGACNDSSGIDPALLRAGRLDRQIAIALPTVDALRQILAFHLDEDLEKIGDLSALGVLCAGMTGADVMRLVRDARRRARREDEPLARKHLIQVLDEGAAGLGPDLQRRIATHEAGHAVAAVSLGISEDVTVSVVTKGSSRGQTVLGSRVTLSGTRRSLDNAIIGLLAGRAAEEVVLGNVSAGAGGDRDSDLARATRTATDIVVNYGLADSGSLIWYGQHGPDNPVLYDRATTDQVSQILASAYQKALCLMWERKSAVVAVAEALIERRALVHADLMAIIGAASVSGGEPRPTDGP